MSNVKKKTKKIQRQHKLTRSRFVNDKIGRFGTKKKLVHSSRWVTEKIEKIEITGGK